MKKHGFKGLKKFSGGGGGWSPSENSVCPRPLLQFLQFMSVRLSQFMLEGRDVELDNCSPLPDQRSDSKLDKCDAYV